jgi:hypothetical protein
LQQFLTTTSPDCGLKYYPSSGRLEDHFERITVLEEDEEISKDQAEEDLLLFGSRPKPLDPEEVYSIAAEPMELDRLPRSTKRGAPASDNEELERPAKSYKRDPDEFRTVQPEPPSGTQQTDPQPISREPRGGKSRLDTWLHLTAPPLTPHPIPPNSHTQVLQALETREIEYFRNVHIKQPPSAPDHRRDEEPDSVEALAFGARIYYRNILDAYPAVPGYLARRLAEANWRRAERLRRGFWEGTESEEPRCESGDDREAMVSAAGFSADVMAPTVIPSARLAIPEAGDDVALTVDPGAGATGSRRDFHHYLHEFHPLCIPSPPPISPSSLIDPFGSPPDTRGLPATEPEVSFWSGEKRQSGPYSSKSRFSSKNSSLRGSGNDSFVVSPTNCSHQDPNSPAQDPNSPVLDLNSPVQDPNPPALTLPPPPVVIGTQLSFVCDVCGNTVRVLRRRDWKYVIATLSVNQYHQLTPR